MSLRAGGIAFLVPGNRRGGDCVDALFRHECPGNFGIHSTKNDLSITITNLLASGSRKFRD
eukprot:3809613-Pyramimonas_sp.AAC.1